LFRPTRAKVIIDGEDVATRMHTALHAGAFDVNLGGVLRVFPQAREPGVLQFQPVRCRPRRSLRTCPHWSPVGPSEATRCVTPSAGK
jgi:hypothetical protein